MKKVILISFILLALVFPFGVSCGNLRKTCTTPPDAAGYIHRVVSYKPVIIVAVDSLFNFDLPLIYFNSSTSEFVGSF